MLNEIFQSVPSCERTKEDPCFAGGAVGYFGYDLFPWIEDYDRLTSIDDLDLPDCCFGFYDRVLLFDHLQNQWLLAGAPVFQNRQNLKSLMDQAGESVRSRLEEYRLGPDFSFDPSVEFDRTPPDSNFTKPEYLAAVEKAIDYIYAGDIYQINLSQRFHTQLSASPFDLFRVLRNINPSYYGAYMAYSGHGVISSSPELFLRRSGAEVETRPIKGTRPRGKSAEEDKGYKRELHESPKDSAELSMIVDLERNDLGRVCEYGSVVVDEHRYIETLPTVFHTISTVRGELKDDIGVVDLIRATFPGGSITGCPKIRSIEIIDELEPTRRNVYTGSIGYIDFNGDMELNIAIRTLIFKGRDIYYQVGGGIVADSDPEAEYEETLDKALAMQKAISVVKAGDE
jgi:para-aminobenzoate synthetase component 1